MHKQPLTELEESGLTVHGLAVGSPSQNSDCFRMGIAWALKHKNTDTDKLACDHKWVARWAHHDCEKCPAVKLGNSKSDREDYGVAAGKTFKNMEQAKFYQNHGRLPE